MDARPAAGFAAGHIPGSVANTLRPAFASWLGWLVEPAAVTGTVIDVRQANEYTAGHVPGARSIELGSIPTTAPPDGPLTIMCAHGERAMTAASLLAGRGHPDLAILAGGPATWATATGRSMVSGP